MAVEDAPVDRADHPATGAQVDQPWVGRRDSRADHGVEPKLPPASLPRASRSSRSFPRRRSLRHPSVDAVLFLGPARFHGVLQARLGAPKTFPWIAVRSSNCSARSAFAMVVAVCHERAS